MLLTCLHDLLPSLPPSPLLPSAVLCPTFLSPSLPLSAPSLTISLQIADLYRRQQQIQNQGDKAEPEDYY